MELSIGRQFFSKLLLIVSFHKKDVVFEEISFPENSLADPRIFFFQSYMRNLLPILLNEVRVQEMMLVEYGTYGCWRIMMSQSPGIGCIP